jgi:prophage antirepressor-like protein
MKNLLVEVLGHEYSKITQINVGDQTWYKAQDICKVIGIKNTSLAVNGNVRIGYFGVEDQWICHIGKGKKAPLYISEIGLYMLILKSRKPAAYLIKSHLSKEILPGIMKSGIHSIESQL